MGRNLLGTAVLTMLMATGCATTDCQSTCQRIYDESGSNCGIKIPGFDSQSEPLAQCIQGCEYALDRPGELGAYDPNVPNRSGSDIDLENERQAAEWMECVAAVPCEDLSSGYCAPLLPDPN